MPSRPQVPFAVQRSVFEKVDAALASSAASARPSSWRGAGARGGVPTRAATSASVAAAPVTAAAQTRMALGASGKAAKARGKAEPGRYWKELSAIAGPAVCSDVQRWVVRYVEGLSMDEIEMLAGEED